MRQQQQNQNRKKQPANLPKMVSVKLKVNFYLLVNVLFFFVKKLKLFCSEVAKISISSLFLSFFNLYPFLFHLLGCCLYEMRQFLFFFTALILVMLFISGQPAWPNSDAVVRSLPHSHPLKCGLCSNPKCDVVPSSFLAQEL